MLFDNPSVRGVRISEGPLYSVIQYIHRLKKMSTIEENTQIPSAQKTEGQTDGCPTSPSKETKHAEDAGQKNGPRPTCRGREVTDGGPIGTGPCCVM